MKGFDARQIATMLHSMAKARYRPADDTFSSALEGQAEAVIGLFNAQELANTVWAYATMKRQPGRGLMRALEGQTAAIVGTFNAQDVANTLWAYATMGREPGSRVMQGLEEQTHRQAGTFQAQNVSNTLWAYATMGREPGAGVRTALERRAESLVGKFDAQHVSTTLWAYAKMGRKPGAQLMRGLERRTEAILDTFEEQGLTNTIWAYATMGQEPGAGLMWGLEGRAETEAGTFNAQDVANTLWAYATMGREPGAGLMRGLEGQAEALVSTFNAQDVANTLWAVCVICILSASQQASSIVHVVAHRLVSPGLSASLNFANLSQLHQVFVWCRVEGKLHVEALNDLPSLKDECRRVFLSSETDPSGTQNQVSKTLRDMGLSVQDEFLCPMSGYSIDMLVRDPKLTMGGESGSSGGVWAVEFDGPQHFLASRAPTGATLLKRRTLELLGHALVSLPHWEWAACNRNVEKEQQYLQSKLRSTQFL